MAGWGAEHLGAALRAPPPTSWPAQQGGVRLRPISVSPSPQRAFSPNLTTLLAPSSPPLRPQGRKAKAQATHSGISPLFLNWPHLHQTVISISCPEHHPPSVSPARLGTGHSAR